MIGAEQQNGRDSNDKTQNLRFAHPRRPPELVFEVRVLEIHLLVYDVDAPPSSLRRLHVPSAELDCCHRRLDLKRNGIRFVKKMPPKSPHRAAVPGGDQHQLHFLPWDGRVSTCIALNYFTDLT